jgi:tetratricopeptide (TPR) repeat protein
VGRWLAIHAAFAALALAILQPALSGPFVSDDHLYSNHPYTQELSLANLVAIFDPFGPAKLYTANYEPVHLGLHALARQIFADSTLGYHCLNAWIHALVATLAVALWSRKPAQPARSEPQASGVCDGPGIPLSAAAFGGVLFVVHPANVEAVAWISQLKTTVSVALALGALLCLPRRGAVATALFGLALLTKASAAFALPMAAGFAWARRGPSRRGWAFVAAWALLLAAYALPQLASFEHLGRARVEAFSDPWVQLRTIGATGARYLAMAATGFGVSAFQEPDPARSPLDPWWLASLGAAALLAWRLAASLRRRSDEAAFWLGALAAFAPVSQLFPFLNPIADRYLYTMLPGLIGAVLCAAYGAPVRLPRPARTALIAGAAALAALFAAQSFGRARLWQSETLLNLDAARHYPEGASARFLRARAAAQAGDVETAVAELRAASLRGVDNFLVLQRDPGLWPLHGEPAFEALVREVAGRWIERATERGVATQAELRFLGLAHRARGELDLAVAALERALAAGGPQDAQVAAELAETRELRARAGAEPPVDP